MRRPPRPPCRTETMQPLALPQHGLRLALGDDPARLQDGDALAELLDLGQDVARQEDRDPVACEPGDQLADVDDAVRVEAVRGLVEDHQLRPPEERRGDPEPLAHAGREPSRLPLGCVRRGRPDRAPREPRPSRREFGDSPREPEETQVVDRGEVRVERGSLHEGADAIEDGPPGRYRLAEERRDTARRPDQPEEHPDRGRLAGPVRPEEAVHAARRHAQIDAGHRLDVAEALDQARRRDDGTGPRCRHVTRP